MAEDLPRGFKAVTIDDHGIIEHINRVPEHLDFAMPDVWRLHVALNGDYWFNVSFEYRRMHAYESLTFHVDSVLTERPPL